MTAPILLSALLLGVPADPGGDPRPAASPAGANVVFLVGDEEYRSEESMPMLAAILQRDHGITPTVLFTRGADGAVDPMRLDHLPGLEALEDADLLVLFTRWRELPDDQMRQIIAYIESGRPVVGFRTGTHAFKYPRGSPFAAWNEEKIAALVGQRWIVHHGHFSDGEAPLTEVTRAEGADSPILNGVDTPFEAYSWLYHVTGGGDALAPGSEPLLIGKTLRSKQLQAGRGDRFPPVQPVAWTKTNPFSPAGAAPGRVFFTTLGHPYDFKLPAVRRLAVQGVLWALGRGGEIPEAGVNAAFDKRYEPSNSGFGTHRPGRSVEEVLSEAGVE